MPDKSNIPKTGDMQVSWIPQIPGKPFTVTVSNAAEGRLLLAVLAEYDLFQLSHRIKPDYCNTGSLEIWDGDEWVDVEIETGEPEPDTEQECWRFDMEENRRGLTVAGAKDE